MRYLSTSVIIFCILISTSCDSGQSQLREELTNAKAEAESLKAELARATSKIDQLSQQERELNSRAADAELLSSQREADMKSLKAEIKRSQEESAAIRDHATRLQQQRAELETLLRQIIERHQAEQAKRKESK